MDYTKIPLVFNVRKPVGISSFGVVHHFKKNLNFDFGKIGHFGTLDPFAEGVLLIGIQGAQRLNDYVHELMPKTYRARGLFGGKTESGDLTSPVIINQDINPEWIHENQNALEIFLCEKFLGEYWQGPHAISATKFEGKRLYLHALEGRIIKKEKVKREIYAFSLIDYSYPYLEFSVTVSSGTYVRSLFEEIAELLGGVGALETLERTAIGALNSENALLQKNWPVKNVPFSLEKYGIPLDHVLLLDGIFLTDAETKRYVKGQRFPMQTVEKRAHAEQSCSQNYFWVYHHEGTLIGLAQSVNEELQAIFNLQLSIAIFS
jgi:tRNA pseudouridine55 synthase